MFAVVFFLGGKRMIQIKIKDNEQDYRAVRIEVFMKEQGFQNEFDEIDAVATHLTVYVDGELAGCARCFPHQEDATWGQEHMDEHVPHVQMEKML